MLLVPVILIALLHRRKVWGDTSCYVCEDTMYRFEDSCYQFVTDRTDLATGKANCETIGFHLVFIETSEEQDFLASTGDNVTPQREYWIGIERNANGEHVWMDGTALTYSNFDTMDEGGECFRLKHQSDYIWADRDCNYNTFGYICERERVCEENTYTFGDSCYQFNTDKTDIMTAKTSCEAKGFHLVYIGTSEEQDFLASYVDIVSPSREYWIGIEKNADGEQVWMDGSALTYSNIEKIKNDGECFRMKDKGAYAWEDHDCTHNHYGSICEREGGCREEVATTQSLTTRHDPTTIAVATIATQPITTVSSTAEADILTTVVTQQALETTSTAPSTTVTEPSTTTKVASTTEEKSQTTVVTEQALETTSTAPSTTVTEPSTTTKVASTTEEKSQTTLFTEQALETTSTAPSTTVTEPSTTTKVSSTTEEKNQTTVVTEQALETTSTAPSTTSTEPSTTQVLQQTTGSTTSIPTSTAPRTTDQVLTTNEDVITTEMETLATVTTQGALETTNTITSTAHTTPLSDEVITTQLTNAPSTPKTTEQTSDVPSSTASSTPDLTTLFVPPETLPTTTVAKRKLLSSRFRLLATDTLLVDAYVSLTTRARSVVRCASSCIKAETCSHFSFAPSSSRCLMGYITVDGSDRFVEESGSNTYTVH